MTKKKKAIKEIILGFEEELLAERETSQIISTRNGSEGVHETVFEYQGW